MAAASAAASRAPRLALAAAGGAAAGVLATLAVQRAERWWRRLLARPRVAGGTGALYLGVDLGGTTVSVGLVDDDGALQGDVRSALLSDVCSAHTPERVAACMARLAQEALASAGRALGEVAAVGVCSPGLLDFERGRIKVAANLRGWRDVPLTELLAAALGVAASRVVLEHDSNTALLAEVWAGAARGRKDVVLLTLGTGVGAGVMCGGRLLRGARGEAGELGHAILVPGGRVHGGAGVRGIVEAYASASGVVARAAEGPPPAASSLHGVAPLSCEEIFRHAAGGDAYAAQVVSDTAKYLAICCINCARFYDPEIVLFTGGMSLAGEKFFAQVREHFAAHHWNIAPVTLELRAAAAPAHAGVIGAAFAARSRARGGA